LLISDLQGSLNFWLTELLSVFITHTLSDTCSP